MWATGQFESGLWCNIRSCHVEKVAHCNADVAKSGWSAGLADLPYRSKSNSSILLSNHVLEEFIAPFSRELKLKQRQKNLPSLDTGTFVKNSRNDITSFALIILLEDWALLNISMSGLGAVRMPRVDIMHMNETFLIV
ncbi:hypothetical protein AAG906_018084 [Vitis piasezkii]